MIKKEKRALEIKRDAKWTTIKKDFRVNKTLYFLLLPVIAYYIIFHYMPMYGAVIAFKDFAPAVGVADSPWVGLKHFISFFTSPSFRQILGNTVRISVTSLVFSFPAPIILALLINELKNVRYAKFIQNLTYLPHFISLVVVCGMVKTFCSQTGIITYVLSLFGMERVNLMNDPAYFVPVYVLSGIWQEMGWGSIIYLAALTGVDKSLYEAASIDGAGRWKQLLHVTIPSIMPTIMIMLILRMGQIFSVGYEKILLLSNDATIEVSEIISTYVYNRGLLQQDWSFSTAVGLFNSVINIVFLYTTNTISKKFSDTSLW